MHTTSYHENQKTEISAPMTIGKITPSYFNKGGFVEGTSPAELRKRLKILTPNYEITEPISGIAKLVYSAYNKDNTTIDIKKSDKIIGTMIPKESIIDFLYKRSRDIARPGFDPLHVMPQGQFTIDGGSYTDTAEVLRKGIDHVLIYTANPARKVHAPLKTRRVQSTLDELTSPKKIDGWPHHWWP